jgi:hypothetical protein
MPHTFPPRRIRDGEPVDPDVFNETFQDIAGKLNGRLNEHDIDAATLKSSVAVASDAYYAIHAVTKASDPDLENVAPAAEWLFAGETPTGDPKAVIDDNPAWESLVDDGSTSELSVTFDSSDDTIIIFAQAQHFAWVRDEPESVPEPSTTARIQYALRVDGVVLEDTTTGAFFVPDPPPMQWYRARRVENFAAPTVQWDSDWRHILHMQNTVGVNNPANATRLIRATDLQDGSHTVSLVARRIPRSDYRVDEDGTGVTVATYNRRLFVLRIKGRGPYAGGTPALSINAVDDGETVTLGSVFTNSLEAARTATNALTTANVARGALRNEHLPSLVYGADIDYIQPASSVPQNPGAYPGYGVDDPAWITVNDGVGGTLDINGPVGGWRFDLNPGTFIVLANVQVWRIQYVGVVPDAEDVSACAVFTLAFTNSVGTRTLIGSTEVVINAHNPSPTSGADIHEPIGADVPLMWMVDTTTLSAANKRINKVEVLVSYWDGSGNADTIEVNTQRGSIHAFALKNVYPS